MPKAVNVGEENDRMEFQKYPVQFYTVTSSKLNTATSKTIPPKKDVFPTRSLINILLIILSSIQVLIITNSPVYLRSSLVRQFLSFYADQSVYPSLFDGTTYQLQIYGIKDLQTNLMYLLTSMSTDKQQQTLQNINFAKSNITLQVQYRPNVQLSNNKTKYNIDPKRQLTDPFNISNVTSMQIFLLDIQFFSFVIDNLVVQNNGGLIVQYTHTITYSYKGGYMKIYFNIQINKAQINNLQASVGPNYSYKLIYLQTFFIIIILMALASLFLHAIYMRVVFVQFYIHMQKQSKQKTVYQSNHSDIWESGITLQDHYSINNHIESHIKLRKITIINLKWKDYISIFQFDIVFSTIANIFHIIANVALSFGEEPERLIGLGCLFSWMTIFRIFKKNKKLILMYDVIKISIVKVIEFLLSFSILLMGYTFLGMCVFSKVSFFSSMSNTVTTLVSLIAGDSIDMITSAMALKTSNFFAMFYIFSYIILFVHAIHNILTSIIKQFYMLKRLKLIQEEKTQKNQQDLVYMEQILIKNQLERNQTLVKITDRLERELLKGRLLKRCNEQSQKIRRTLITLQNTFLKQKWMVYDLRLHRSSVYQEELQRRYILLKTMMLKMKLIFDKKEKQEKQDQPEPQIYKSRNIILTEANK